jgi:DNA-binding NarL/FixJ family response regulator
MRQDSLVEYLVESQLHDAQTVGVGMGHSTSIALIDDHPLMVEALVSVLSRSRNNFTIVATGASAIDFIDIVARYQPNIVILDLNMPGDVYAAISKVGRTAQHTKVIAFTAITGVESAIRALDAGASAYVLKGSSSSELLEAIETVQRNEIYLTKSFAGQVITALREASLRQIAAQAVKLSVRESQIIRLLLRGQTNKEIATALKISEKTVKHYMTILMQKLSARNRLEVVIAAQKISEREIPIHAQDARARLPATNSLI